MQSNSVEKPTVIVVQGHKYTFFSNGLYLCSELMQTFNVVLVVPDSYKKDRRFSDICKLMRFREVVYFPSNTYVPLGEKRASYGINIIKQYFDQRLYSKIGKALILKYNPVALLQHDYIHIENMYFFFWARRLLNRCKNIVVLSTAPSNERTLNGFSKMRMDRSLRIAHGNKWLGKIVFWMVSLLKYIESYIRNIFLPVIVLRQMSGYGPSSFDNIDLKPRKIPFHHFMVFEASEEKFYTSLFGSRERVARICSPISTGMGLNNRLFDIKSNKGIAILFGLTGSVSGFDGELLSRWCELVNTLSKKYGGTAITIKVHPNLSHTMSDEFGKFFKSRCSNVHFVGSRENGVSTEELILNSWMVIGDSSSVLPWANYVGGKVVLSMDIEKYPNSGDMRVYSGISVFSWKDDFNSVVEDIDKLEVMDRAEISLPSVQDFIA